MRQFVLLLVAIALVACGAEEAAVVTPSPTAASDVDMVVTAAPVATAATERTERVPAPVEVEQDAALWDEVSYVVREGVAGERGIETGTVYSEPVAHVVRTGTLSEEAMIAAATDAVEAYLTAYQAGDYAAVQAASRDTATISEAAAAEASLKIIGWAFEGRGRPQAQAIQAQSLGWRDSAAPPVAERDFDIEGGPINEPFGIEVTLPAQIELEAFGRSIPWEGKLLAIWDTENGWQVEPWGVVAAGKSAAVLGDARLLGAALWPRETLVVSEQGEGVDLVQIRLNGAITNLGGLLTGEQTEGYGWHWLPRVPLEVEQLTLDWVSSRSTPETTTTIDLVR